MAPNLCKLCEAFHLRANQVDFYIRYLLLNWLKGKVHCFLREKLAGNKEQKPKKEKYNQNKIKRKFKEQQ